MATPNPITQFNKELSNQPLEQVDLGAEKESSGEPPASKPYEAHDDVESNWEGAESSGHSAAKSEVDDFGTLFCETFKIPSSEFSKTLLNTNVHWYSKLLTSLIATLFPSVFSEDFRHLERLRQTRNRHEYVSEMMYLADYHKQHLPMWRRALGLRVSIGKLSRLSVLLRSKPKHI